MSIKRIDTMTGSEIRALLDETAYSSRCDSCPLIDGDADCCFPSETCLDNVMHWLLEDVDESETNNHDIGDAVIDLSKIMTDITSLIYNAWHMSRLPFRCASLVEPMSAMLEDMQDDDE